MPLKGTVFDVENVLYCRKISFDASCQLEGMLEVSRLNTGATSLMLDEVRVLFVRLVIVARGAWRLDIVAFDDARILLERVDIDARGEDIEFMVALDEARVLLLSVDIVARGEDIKFMVALDEARVLLERVDIDAR